MTAQAPRLKRCFQQPSIVAYKRSKNLRDHLVKAKVPLRRGPSWSKCGFSLCKHLCKACVLSHLNPGEIVTSHKSKRSGDEWKITASMDCLTQNVIYKLECKKCPSFVYIGETSRHFCDRLTDHRGYITRRGTKHPVGSHFTQRGHSVADLRAIPIERVLPKDDHMLRKQREKLWIIRYDAVSFGANSRD